MPLSPSEVADVARLLWSQHQNELALHDSAHDYLRGLRGIPEIPDGAGDELKDLARMAVKNVLRLVVESFAQNLGVVGFRSPAADTDSDVWKAWQEQRLDARQSEAIRPALTYGSSYAVVDNAGAVRLRTPRQLLAMYQDPSVDQWPAYALETWIDYSGRTPERRGCLIDAEAFYTFSLGRTRNNVVGEDRVRRIQIGESVVEEPHDFGLCPAVRFINDRDAEDVVVGEVRPLIPQQRAINAVNFDRLTVSRYGAFPQKYAIGWAPAGPDELIKASVARLQAFADDDVKVGAFPQASVDPYNSILQEMLAHVAMTAQIPISSVTGSISNLSADALAMAEAPYQRKLTAKRESFGESWEQVLMLMGQARGIAVPGDAEVVWRTGEVRSFAQVVDGIVKLEATGIPVTDLLQDIPGWSQQRIDSVTAAVRREAGRATIDRLVAPDVAGDSGTPA